jgi:hypothetical protein
MDRPKVDPEGASAASQLHGESGSHAENRAPMSSLRGWRTTLVRRGRDELVGETGLAPAWAFAREFLRLVCIRSTTRRKKFGLPVVARVIGRGPPTPAERGLWRGSLLLPLRGERRLVRPERLARSRA